MARVTFNILQTKSGNINRTMPEGYHLKVSQRNGYTAIDLYNGQEMVNNLTCGTNRECAQALDLAYTLRVYFKLN